ncbi:tetratricopeptide repeat protein [Pedobacter jamesrossensis]|uniref:histidine kinase n=1 Tax=Pedobacter jamesrossensis TaxID=1908238 RepID=A0ABV8NNY1_9SPHI
MKCLFNLKIFKRFIACFAFFIIAVNSIAQTKTSQQKLDSLLIVNQKYIKQDSVKASLYIDILRLYGRLNNQDKVEEYALKSLQLANKLGSKNLAGLAHNRAGLFYHGVNNYQKAEENYKKALKEYLSINNQERAAGIYMSLGAMYIAIPDYGKALEMNQKAVAIYQKTNSEDNLSSCYLNISEIYQDLGQHKQALEYLRMALKFFIKNEDYRGQALAYEGIGTAYFKASPAELISMDILPNQKLNAALENFNRSLKIAELVDDNDDILSANKTNIGLVYEKMGLSDLAFKSFQSSIEISKKSNAKRDYAESLLALGNFYNHQKDYLNAVKLLTQTLNIAQQSKFLDIERDANLVLSEAYDKLKKYDESLAFYKQYVLVKDEIFNEEKEREITRRQMQLDFGVKEKDYQLKQQVTDAVLQQQVLLAKQQQQKLVLRQQELALSDKEKILQRLKFLQKQKDLEAEKIVQGSIFERSQLQSRNETLEKNRQISVQEQQIKYDGKIKIFLSVAITLVLFTAGLIYFNQRKTTRLNKIINKQKRELEQLGRVKDRIFSVVSHDMRTPVNSLISFIQLLEEGNIEQVKLNRYAASLKNSLTYTSSMMENLLKWAASQMQGFNPYLETIDAYSLSIEVVNSLHSVADLKQITIQNNIDKGTLFKADSNMFSLVIRNLISNSIKFTSEKGIITLSSESNGEQLQIKVNDNGVGMSEEQVSHFNKSEYQGAGVSTPGTNKEKGTGLGLLLCRTFMGLMDSKITVNSTKNEGTQFTLWLKKAY